MSICRCVFIGGSGIKVYLIQVPSISVYACFCRHREYTTYFTVFSESVALRFDFFWQAVNLHHGRFTLDNYWADDSRKQSWIHAETNAATVVIWSFTTSCSPLLRRLGHIKRDFFSGACKQSGWMPFVTPQLTHDASYLTAVFENRFNGKVQRLHHCATADPLTDQCLVS